MLGFRPDRVRVLPSGDDQRLRPDDVAAAIRADRAAGLRPLFVAAAAGATNTGAVDPLAGLADVCREHGVWLHVDAAYGGFAALTERGRRALAGLELSDSVTLDPHKWLYQPLGCGCLLVREGRLLEQAFSIAAPYLRDAAPADGEVELLRPAAWSRAGPSGPCGCGSRSPTSAWPRSARRSTARSTWPSWRVARMVEDPALEPVASGELGITCFRRRTPGGEDDAARVNAALVAAWAATGRGLVSSTRLGGRYAVRLCALNNTTSAGDVERVLDFFAAASVPY